MHPAEFTEIFHYLQSENPITFPEEFTTIQPNTLSSYFQFDEEHINSFSSTGENHHPISSMSNNSTSDEDHSKIKLDERKQRRMISNRESARRSRMRKQRHLDELWSQMIRLRKENQVLIDKLNCLSESHDKASEENLRLKEETFDLKQMLQEVQDGRNNFVDEDYVFREIDGGNSSM